MDTSKPQPEPVKTSPTGTDWLFLLCVALALAAVAYLGTFAYKEALKTEESKRNGEAVAGWMQDTSSKRFEADFALTACAGAAAVDPNATAAAATTVAAPPAQPKNWGECMAAMLTQPDIRKLDNPFLYGVALTFAPACNPEDHTLAGNLVIEKITATPPGSAIPSIISPLALDTPIDQKIQVRLAICDKGAYAVKVAEFEF